MGVPKQSLELAKGKPLASLGLNSLLTSPFKRIKVVVNCDDSKDWLGVYATVGNTDVRSIPSIIHIVVCEDANDGMSKSIRCGLKSLLCEEPALDAIVIALADQPFITPEWIDMLIRQWRERPELDYVATAVHEPEKDETVLMPPAIISRSMFDCLLQLKGDAGARKWFHSAEFIGYGVAAEDRATSFDVDTPADFEWAQKHYQTC